MKTKDIVMIAIIGILAIALIVNIQRNGFKQQQPEVVTIRDTTYLPGEPIYVEVPAPKLTKSEDKPVPPQLKPDTNCKSLGLQYDRVVRSYSKVNSYTDTTKLDSNLLVSHADVQYNQLVGLKFEFYPQTKVISEKTTITHPPQAKRQLSIGGSIGVLYKRPDIGFSVEAGLMYKNRKGDITGITGGYNTLGFWQGEVHQYILISLH